MLGTVSHKENTEKIPGRRVWPLNPKKKKKKGGEGCGSATRGENDGFLN